MQDKTFWFNVTMCLAIVAVLQMENPLMGGLMLVGLVFFGPIVLLIVISEMDRSDAD
jgi:hypothetical protein